MPGLLKDMLQESFTLDGKPLSLSRQDLESIILSTMKPIIDGMTSKTTASSAADSSETVATNGSDKLFQVYQWHGEVIAARMLPQDYVIKSVPMKVLWNYWFDGDLVDKIGPLRMLCDRTSDIPRKSKRTFVKAKDCMQKLIELGLKQGTVIDAASLLTLSTAERDAFYHKAMSALIMELDLTTARSRKFRNDSKFTTVYNALHTKKRKVIADEEGEVAQGERDGDEGDEGDEGDMEVEM